MCRDYVDIAGRSAAKGHQTKEGWEKEAIFELNVSYLENSKRYVYYYYYYYESKDYSDTLH